MQTSEQEEKHYTFEEYAAMEPRLLDLLRDIEAADQGGPRFCANAVWYGYGTDGGGFRRRLLSLMGYLRELDDYPDALGSADAYHVGLNRLYRKALPDCRGCGCLGPYDSEGEDD